MTYQYCPKCGNNPLKEIWEGEHRREQCPACGFVFYFNPKPAVGAIITQGDKVLLNKRAEDPFKGYWDVPGGFLEQGELPEQGVKREIREELNIEIELHGVLGNFVDFYGPGGDATLNTYYLATVASGEPKAGPEAESIEWFDKYNLPKDVAFKNGQDALAAWQRLE